MRQQAEGSFVEFKTKVKEKSEVIDWGHQNA